MKGATYAIGIATAFVARHFLIGGDWGGENVEHSHYYRVECALEGRALDAHGYMIDFVEFEGHVEAVTAHYRDALLNDLPEFSGLNPSVEHLARLFCEALSSRIAAPTITGIRIKVWEKEGVWASYSGEHR
jgi:6-pyruvoyltetrahydropterin/6-carboxytetrahydropterin synthase